MRELALFAGAGGGILGGKLLGWRTVCAVEFDRYARDVLIARQNDGTLAPFPIWDDVRTFDGGPWRGAVDIVSGGFPCQDISPAGKGAGIEGERSGLWAEMARIIGEVRPRFVLVENSSALVGRGLGRVLGDLAAMGYDAEWGVLGADDAGAPHVRKRIWILAHTNEASVADAGHLQGWGWAEPRKQETAEAANRRANDAHANGKHNAVRGDATAVACEVDRGGVVSGGSNSDRRARSSTGSRQSPGVADADEARCEESVSQRFCTGERDQSSSRMERPDQLSSDRCSKVPNTDETRSQVGGERTRYAIEGSGQLKATRWFEAEPNVGRVAHGVAARVDRLQCLGNGQVPAVVRLAWMLLSARIREHGGTQR